VVPYAPDENFAEQVGSNFKSGTGIEGTGKFGKGGHGKTSNCEFRIANLCELELKFELRNSQFEIPLRSLGLTAHLLLNLPVREKILVAAPGTFPGSLDRVSALLMEHFHNQVTVQTHGRMTKDLVSLGGFGHNCHRKPPVGWAPHPQTSAFTRSQTNNL
jgi:hypothetical protein